ncbi:MAG: hypothetical protein EHM70_05395 [Chloroflexota bacterium]|nr:MAG: hypothetical protein EHM70_05395 [Chloroflexota bacterium]
MAKNVLTQPLSEPLGGAKTAKVHIDVGDGNLTIDSLTGGEPVLANGMLQYLESQELPIRSVDTSNGQATLTLKARRGKQSWLRLPWAACNGATTWQVHLNPDVIADINAHSNGGNIRLDLASLQVNRLAVDNGGGNIDVALPEHAANLDVMAKTGGGGVSIAIGSLASSNRIEAASGAGNVVIHLPGSLAARIHATSGMGKVIIDPCFSQIDKTTFQSPGYDHAANRVEITAKSGAGNVTVRTKVAENHI